MGTGPVTPFARVVTALQAVVGVGLVTVLITAVFARVPALQKHMDGGATGTGATSEPHISNSDSLESIRGVLGLVP